jgi:hypothetical protein
MEMIGYKWANVHLSIIVVFLKQYPLFWHRFSVSLLIDGVNDFHYVCIYSCVYRRHWSSNLILIYFLVFFSTIVSIVAFVLLSCTFVVPAVGMTLFSLALGIGSVMILTCTALTLPQEYVGTGVGIHKSANNVGTTIITILAGYLQDHAYHDGDTDYTQDLTEDYVGVMYLYIALSSLAAMLSIFWWILDRTRLKGWLQATKAERQRRLDHKQNTRGDLRSPNDIPKQQLAAVGGLLLSTKTYRYCIIYIVFLILAWAMFFSFALLPVYQNENSDISG